MRSLAKGMWRRCPAFFRKYAIVFIFLFVLAGAEAGPSVRDTGWVRVNSAEACSVYCSCIRANHRTTQRVIIREHGSGRPHTDRPSLAYTTANQCVPGSGTRGWISYQFCRHRELFIVFYWFKEHILAALMMMTEQLVSVAMEQMFIIGSFFDAQMQLETQMLLQELTAKAHKDYHPSFEMCEIGTLARSLSASQRRGEYNAYLMSQHLQDRQMRNVAMASAAGKGMDVVHRWTQFKDSFCNPAGNNQELGPRAQNPICDNTQPVNRDSDVDFVTTVGYPLTIDLDLADNTMFIAEKRIFALASNLYGHDVFSYFPEAFFKNPKNQDDYVYVRSIVAKRSVAQNTFNNIIALKSSGNDMEAQELRPYMEKVLEQLGVTGANEALLYLGIRPSYYAQMEFLTKKLYQRPEFYTSLYDKPANVERKKAAMRALGLAQNMDLFKSKLRSEAALAVLTEMEIYKAQEALQDKMNDSRATGIQ